MILRSMEYHRRYPGNRYCFRFSLEQTKTKKRMRKIYQHLNLAAGFVLLCCFMARAQEATISGTIKDEAGAAVPGANILIKGTTMGTTSDAEGVFSIQASPSDVLVISFIGYKDRKSTRLN